MVDPEFRLKTASLEAAKVKLRLDLALLRQSANRAVARFKFRREANRFERGILGLRDLIRKYISKS